MHDYPRVLVIGASGMLGAAIIQVCRQKGLSFFAPSSRELDIIDPAGIESFLHRHAVNAIVNCAVRKDFRDVAGWTVGFTINAVGPMLLQTIAMERGIHLIQISTDIMFNPVGGPFSEHEPVSPKGPYAISKYGGEVPGALVVRGSFLGSGGRRWRSLLDRLAAGQRVEVGKQEKWNGLTSLEFADLLSKYLQRGVWITGIRHVFGPDTTRYDFAAAFKTVMRLSGQLVDNGRVRDLRLTSIFNDFMPEQNWGSLEERARSLMLPMDCRGPTAPELGR